MLGVSFIPGKSKDMKHSSPQVMKEPAPAEAWPGRRRLLNRLRMRQVALLLGLAEGRTLSAAAAEIGVSQPAATKLLRELESALGGVLFDRAGRQLRVNAAGRLVIAQFEAIRGAVEALGRDLQAAGEEAGTLAVGGIIAAMSDLLSPAVCALRAELPRLTVRLSIDASDRLIDALARGEFDVVVARPVGRFSHREYLFRELSGDPLALVASPGHPLAGRRRLALRELMGESWVLPPPDRAVRDQVDREFRLARQDLPAGLIETPSIYAMTCLVAEGRHVAAMPLSVARLLARHGMLCVLPVRMRAGPEAYGTIVSRRRPLSAAGVRLVEALHRLADGGGSQRLESGIQTP